MALEVSTKDCSALDDVELSEMADLTAPSAAWEVGQLGKQADEWVLVSQAFQNGSLKGFMFTTLERIGGTPALVIGLASTHRTKTSGRVLRALMDEQYHKALMAFPDEDVLVALRATHPGGLEPLLKLEAVRPSPGVRVNGEERAWGRRLSKRFSSQAFDDRTMIARGDGDGLVVDHDSGAGIDPSVFDGCDVAAGDYLIAWGWAMAEFLEGFGRS